MSATEINLINRYCMIVQVLQDAEGKAESSENKNENLEEITLFAETNLRYFRDWEA